MVNRSIVYCNVLMRCDAPPTALPQRLPPGYVFAPYAPGREAGWAALEAEIGDFDTQQEALAYFRRTYLPHGDKLQRRAIFALDAQGAVVGSCLAWRDRRQDGEVASLHWLVVSPRHEGQGIGRALTERALTLYRAWGELPVYLLTQPWSYPAIRLYASLGFTLLKSDTFADYVNEYDRAVEALRPLLPEAEWRALQACAR